MTTLQWPDNVVPNSIDFWLDTPTRSGGPSILGSERIVGTPAARWRCTLNFRVWGRGGDPSRLLWWRTFASIMAGRAGSVAIGPFDALTPSRIVAASEQAAVVAMAQAQWASTSVSSVFGSTTPFDDMAAVSSKALPIVLPASGQIGEFVIGESPIGGVLDLTTSGLGSVMEAALAGARTVTIAYSGAGTPLAGMYFGIGGAALYLANAITDNGNGTLTIGFSPGLRFAAAIGTVVDFEKPKCVMRLMADDGARAKTGVDWTADTTLDLVEVF
jgi:hypothetical protein